jgi:hypothetical protein
MTKVMLLTMMLMLLTSSGCREVPTPRWDKCHDAIALQIYSKIHCVTYHI